MRRELRSLAAQHDEAKATIEQLRKDLEAQLSALSAEHASKELESLKMKLSALESSLKTEVEAKDKLSQQLSEVQTDLAKELKRRTWQFRARPLAIEGKSTSFDVSWMRGAYLNPISIYQIY